MERIFTSNIQILDEIKKLYLHRGYTLCNEWLISIYLFLLLLNFELNSEDKCRSMNIGPEKGDIYEMFILSSAYISTCIYLSIYLFTYPSIYLFIYLSIYLFIIALCIGFFNSMSQVLNLSNNHTVLYI